MIDVRRFFRHHEHVVVDRPIFLLGNQGGGLTLVSRMLRRHPRVVSVTGDHRYWAGADELQNVAGPILPPELTGIKYKAPPHPVLTPPRSWTYASDELIEAYRKTEKDYTPELESAFKGILKYFIARHGTNGGVRFVDKSQVYTVRLSLINRLLEDCDPKFVLITRNPYVECPRAAMGKAGDMKRFRSKLSWEERLRLCAQHWSNSMEALFEDRDRLEIPVLVVKFEDVLERTPHTLKAICEFAEVDFYPDMLPQPRQRLPLGCLHRDRWFPLRRRVNERYQKALSPADMEIVRERCGRRAARLGYSEPPPA
ncbi:MAG: sulfotransferase [Fidelibacterota bacterium]